MAQPLRVLPANLIRRAEQVKQGVTKLVQRVAQVAGSVAVDETPVDTGESRSSWIASLNGPVSSSIRPYAPYPKYSKALGRGRGENANAGAAKNQQKSVIARYDAGKDNDISIANNSPAIGGLNTGQFPTAQTRPGFVKRAVDAAKRAARNVRLLK